MLVITENKSPGRIGRFNDILRYWTVKEVFCFGITFLAGVTGHELLEHNVPVELIFSGLLGCVIEYFSHARLRGNPCEKQLSAWKRYTIAVIVSLLTWPVHAVLFHHHAEVHVVQGTVQMHDNSKDKAHVHLHQ